MMGQMKLLLIVVVVASLLGVLTNVLGAIVNPAHKVPNPSDAGCISAGQHC